MAAENDEERVKFTIGEVEYEMPDFLDLDLDEWGFVYDVAGIILEDFAPIPENKELEKARQNRLRHPNVLKAFACVGYLRAQPETDKDEAQELVGRVKMLPFLESMADEEPEDDAVDPTSASEPERSSLRSKDDSSASSPPASLPSSDEPDGQPATIGIGG